MQLYTLILLFALTQPVASRPAPAADLPAPAASRPAPWAGSAGSPESAVSVSWPAQCRVSGTANLKATGMGIPYSNSFKLAYDLRIHIDPTGKASVDVSYQGHSSTVKGMLVNDSLIQLNIGQDVPQNFQGDGFSASLKGTIKNGFLSRSNNKIRMFIHVDADGTILWQGLTIPVTGKVDTDTHN